MNVEFERTQEDLIEFNLFHISHSPSIRRQVFIQRILLAILIIIAIVIRIGYLSPSAYIIGFFFGVIIYFAWPYIYQWITIRQVKKMLNEGNNNSLLGLHKLSLSSKGIFYKTLGGESKLDWSSIDRVAQNDKYIFIYIGAVNALVIPKEAFATNQSRKEFLTFVNSNRPRKI